MATQAYTIVSDFAHPGEEYEIAVQNEAVLSEDVDALWESEAGPSRISLKRRIPPRFVAATNSRPVVEPAAPTSSVKPDSNDISSWYASLSRSNQELRPTPTSTPPLPSPAPTASTNPKNRHPKPTKNDWFIRRALSNVPPDAAPTQTSSIANMLEQSPPSLEDPLRPPIFLHLNPTNRGWGMLQRHGWEEGQPLGLGATSQTAPVTPAHEDSPEPDTSRTALVTPLRTTLKVDKRGIGPRSKSTPRPAVTHSMSDIRLAAEKARRERDGRGKRGFARTAKREAEERSRMFQELN
ncbi:hypothetical protein RhiJN_05715 [Ceratobasidium sp. AG-Ba]|nr:hypothetical protein RhiJN_05715 [Ceratobasidium sp. AG-Ba]QRW06645.1 hypothetical protein RhiLY_05644 [Ceratobasidium sp. AG-Ba]